MAKRKKSKTARKPAKPLAKIMPKAAKKGRKPKKKAAKKAPRRASRDAASASFGKESVAPLVIPLPKPLPKQSATPIVGGTGKAKLAETDRLLANAIVEGFYTGQKLPEPITKPSGNNTRTLNGTSAYFI